MDNIRWTTILLALRNPFGKGFFANRSAIESEMTLGFAIYQFVKALLWPHSWAYFLSVGIFVA